ncbi:MAG: tetratricopeptide repeat protein [Pirellulales bacterium]|nr:tetratricopeptide repeat protein [Pirellulales bacterium]
MAVVNSIRQRAQQTCFRPTLLTAATFAVLATSFGCSATETSSGYAPSFTSGGPASANPQNIAQGNSTSPWDRVKNFVVGTSTPVEPVNAPLAPEISLTSPVQSSPNLSTRLAQVAEQSQNRAGAIEHYRRALEQDPRHIDAVMGLARLYDREGDFATATTLYLQAVAIEPGNASVQNDLGLCYARQSRFEEAESALQKAVTAAPDGQLYRNNLATVQVELRKYDAALESLRATHAPEIAEYNLGYLLSQKNEHALARAHFQAALRLKPQFTEAEAALAALGGPPSTAPALGNPAPQHPSQPSDNGAVGPRLGDRYPGYPR